MDNIRLNVPLLRQRVPNLTRAAQSAGLRAATVSNLCTGKIPVGRAEVRTLVALASLANCSLDELLLVGERFEMIETGIKTLDLFAPLVKGGTTGLIARPKMGQLVVLAELLHILKKLGYVTLLLKPVGEHPEIEEVTGDVDVICGSVEEAFNQISTFGATRDIILAADRSHVINNELYQMQGRLEKAGIQSVTTLLVDLKGEAVDEDLPYGPLETLWQFDADLAVRHMYPSVNPVSSTSELIEGAYADPLHLSLAQKAKKLLRRYKELRFLVQAYGIEGLQPSDVQTFQRGERLEAYLTQPLYVAEEMTGSAGVTVSLQETLQDVQRIIEGAEDDRAAKDFMYMGRLG